jgi:RNA polymerase-associated protein
MSHSIDVPPGGLMLVLLEHPLSSYAQKVKIALREKNIVFEARRPEDLGTGKRDGAFGKANPRMEVPVLVPEDGPAIFDSTVILEYIEETYPERPLLPAKASDRAVARMIEDVCDTQYEAINWGFGEILWFQRAEGELAERMKAIAARDTKAMQEWLTERLGDSPWFGGESFGWADAAAAPMVNRSVHYGLAPASGSPLARWHARLKERASVAHTFAEFDKVAAAMIGMTNHYKTGGKRREYRDHRLEWMIRSGGLEVVQAGLRDGNIRFSWPG